MARTEKEIITDIMSCYCRLSPENLYCDGEISRAEGRRKASFINERLRELFAELGREVDEDETYRIYRQYYI